MMKKANSLIVLLFVLASICAYAQKRKVEFKSKNNNSSRIFKLPHPCLVQLKVDTDGYFSKAILDSVNNDTLYISSITNPKHSLSIALNEISMIKITNSTLIKYLNSITVVFLAFHSTAITAIGFSRNINKLPPYLILASIEIGIITKICFAGRKRKFNFNQYSVKGR